MEGRKMELTYKEEETKPTLRVRLQSWATNQLKDKAHFTVTL